MSLANGERPDQVQAQLTTPGLVSMMGHRFLPAATSSPRKARSRDHVVVLTHRLFERRFGSDAKVVGREVRLDGMPYTVVGVLAPGPADRLQNELYLPLAFAPDQVNHDFHWLLVMGRLKPEFSLAQANADMAEVTKAIAEANPRSNMGWGASVEPLQNNFLSRETVTGLWLLLAAVGFVLLIACANVANLLLARGTARLREVAVRSSLGAGRRQIFAQFLTESLVLAAIGGALGVALAAGLLRVILAVMPPYTLPSEADVRLSLPVLVFTLFACVLAGVLAGCAPAWQALRANLVETLKESGRSQGGARHGLRRALVVTEFALALTLLAGGGLAVHSLVKLTNVDLGFARSNLLTFYLPVPDGRYPKPELVVAFYGQLLEKLQAVPGVAAVSASTGMPVNGTNFGMPFHFAGKPFADPSARPGAGFNMVTPTYFHTFGIQIDRGRGFDPSDRAFSPLVAVVNQTFVKKYLADADPLAQRLVVEQLIPGVTKLGPPLEWQIVGVYKDVKNGGPRPAPRRRGDLRSDVVRGRAADARDRTAHGPRSAARAGRGPRPQGGNGDRTRGCRRGDPGRLPRGPGHARNVVRGRRRGPGGLRSGGHPAPDVGRAGLSPARPPCGVGGPHGRAATGLRAHRESVPNSQACCVPITSASEP